ncbi:LOW QUALITY PROTEIN: apolipoprotein L5 [Molossus nigricans]
MRTDVFTKMSFGDKTGKTIKELNTVAGQVDTTHETFTEASLVAKSSGAVSSVLRLPGVALVPVTAGGSLMLSAAGQGLGVAAADNLLTNVLENKNSAAGDRARRRGALPTCWGLKRGGETHLSDAGAAACCYEAAETLRSPRKRCAPQMAQAHPGFPARLRNVVATSRVLFLKATGVQRAGESPVPAMTRGARRMSAAGAGFSLVQDTKSTLQTWRLREEGARTGWPRD